ncbi:hypothetical protein DL96DRAFT_1643421 [Flagelloscypha sp. PMI_526]|nr:hypothetical protein DL96DRAFT_1643421 [Flagelloscypha sp. PMI_526]
MNATASHCLSANPDVSGIGVRTAIYAQNLLSFVPALHALQDGQVNRYELESIETQAMTILITALALLLSTIIEALTEDLSAIHAAIILNLSWMNNTNLFIYLILFIHHTTGLRTFQNPWRWSFWWHVMRNAFSRKKRVDHDASEETGEADLEHETRPRRLVILLGVLHLSLMSAVGFWLWVRPTTFGLRPISSCTTIPTLVVVGVSVPITSSKLRAASFAMYSLVLLPMFNILIPLALVLSFYIHFNKTYEGRLPRTSRLYPIVTLACFQSPWMRSSRAHSQAESSATTPHRIFPISVGLFVLSAINVIFLIDTELTVQRNRPLQEDGEDQWSFGQTLSLLLLLIPLRDVIEGLQRRREKDMQRRVNQPLTFAMLLGLQGFLGSRV